LCRDAATSVCTYFDRVLTLREREFEERYQITDKNVEKWKKMIMEMAKEAV
jgi:hypothetical protein